VRLVVQGLERLVVQGLERLAGLEREPERPRQRRCLAGCRAVAASPAGV